MLSSQNFGPNLRGLAFLVSGPSGVGKSTVVKRILEEVPGLSKLVTTTSRLRRPDEQEGIHYHFVSKDTFERMIEERSFIESKHHFGNYYGLTWAELHMASNRDVIFDVDTEGKKNIVQQIPDRMITIFMQPPSLEEVRRRLTGRSDLPKDELTLRLTKAKEELRSAKEYDYRVENSEVERTVDEIAAIISGERMKRSDWLNEEDKPMGFAPGSAGSSANTLIENGAMCVECGSKAITTLDFDVFGQLEQLPVCLGCLATVKRKVMEDLARTGRSSVIGLNGWGRA